jgi:hypothetical protein
VNSIVRWLIGEKKRVAIAKIAIPGESETRLPSDQNAVDLVPGWNHAFPEQYAIKAGDAVLYDDLRILWAVEQYGTLAGKRVLELGPLEAFHTSMLERYDPADLDAVEANVAAYLRCLITKQVLDLHRAKFHLGNFVRWLERDDLTYDLIVACGVLYHMSDPLYLLELMSRRANAVYLWTHYFDSSAMPQSDLRSRAFVDDTRIVPLGDHTIHLHGRRYYGADQNSIFCGGPEDLHYWMEKPDIINVLRTFGFDDVRIAHIQPDHPGGPAISIFARRAGQEAS